MVILCLTPEDLQLSLNNLSEYCVKWGLEVNVAKTKIVVFRKRGILKRNEHWVYNNELLETVDHFNYLGITFNYTGNFTINIETIYDKGIKAMNSLISNINKYNTNPKISLQLVDAFVSYTISYGCEVSVFAMENILEKNTYQMSVSKF